MRKPKVKVTIEDLIARNNQTMQENIEFANRLKDQAFYDSLMRKHYDIRVLKSRKWVKYI